MGNRAVVVFRSGDDVSPGVYLHWHGGPESVLRFVAEMDRRGVRTGDPSYESARFCEIVASFYTLATRDQVAALVAAGEPVPAYVCDYGLSVGLVNGPERGAPLGRWVEHVDPGDNGVYVLDRGADALWRFSASGSVAQYMMAPASIAAVAAALPDDEYASICDAVSRLAPMPEPVDARA